MDAFHSRPVHLIVLHNGALEGDLAQVGFLGGLRFRGWSALLLGHHGHEGVNRHGLGCLELPAKGGLCFWVAVDVGYARHAAVHGGLRLAAFTRKVTSRRQHRWAHGHLLPVHEAEEFLKRSVAGDLHCNYLVEVIAAGAADDVDFEWAGLGLGPDIGACVVNVSRLIEAGLAASSHALGGLWSSLVVEVKAVDVASEGHKGQHDSAQHRGVSRTTGGVLLMSVLGLRFLSLSQC